MGINQEAIGQMLSAMLKPWHDAIDNPAKAQEQVLQQLLQDYAKTNLKNRNF